MDNSLTTREVTAAVILSRLVEQFTFTQRSSAALRDVMSRVPPAERDMYRVAFEGLQSLRMVGDQSGEIFVTQYGQLFLEFAEPSVERRALPLTNSERAHVLPLLQAAIRNDARFDPPKLVAHPPGVPQPTPSRTGDPAKFWLGAAIMGLIAVSFLYQVLKRL